MFLNLFIEFVEPIDGVVGQSHSPRKLLELLVDLFTLQPVRLDVHGDLNRTRPLLAAAHIALRRRDGLVEFADFH